MGVHVVAEGECVSSIAFQYGFHWKTLWDDPSNAPLRASRSDPFSLAPGDEINIPDKKTTLYTRSTGQRHTFRRKGVPAKLRVQMLDHTGNPRADQPYTLSIDGKPVPGSHRTDGKGWVEQFMSPAAREGLLRVGEGEAATEYLLQLGQPRPYDALDGARDRLRALGFLGDEEGSDGPMDDDTQGALEDFQALYGLDPTGEFDAKTMNKLRDAYGG